MRGDLFVEVFFVEVIEKTQNVTDLILPQLAGLGVEFRQQIFQSLNELLADFLQNFFVLFRLDLFLHLLFLQEPLQTQVLFIEHIGSLLLLFEDFLTKQLVLLVGLGVALGDVWVFGLVSLLHDLLFVNLFIPHYRPQLFINRTNPLLHDLLKLHHLFQLSFVRPPNRHVFPEGIAERTEPEQNHYSVEEVRLQHFELSREKMALVVLTVLTFPEESLESIPQVLYFLLVVSLLAPHVVALWAKLLGVFLIYFPITLLEVRLLLSVFLELTFVQGLLFPSEVCIQFLISALNGLSGLVQVLFIYHSLGLPGEVLNDRILSQVLALLLNQLGPSPKINHCDY